MKKNKSVENAPPLNSQLLQDRSLWVLMNLIGKKVELQVRTGEIYEGILHGVSTEKGLGCVIKMASKRDKDKNETPKPIPTFIVLPQDLVQIYAKEVSFENFRERDFATDTDISGGAFRGKERELQPWMPDSDTTSESLDLNDSKSGSRWDQFKANKDLFGVETDYDENYYTTSLDKSSDFYKLKIKEASRIADEIEKRPTTNVHILEERGFRVESELDEEEKYSSVIRQPSNNNTPTAASTGNSGSSSSGGKYVPPQRRGQADKSSGSINAGNKKEDTSSGSKKEISEETPLPATGALGLQHSSSSLERADSFEDIGGGSSKGSPTMSPGRSSDHSQLAQERLRLRLSLVNERLKNSAPVVTSQDNNNISRSPLLSPLIGDPRGVNALSLEPSTPKIDENVVKEFFDFSLNSKKQQDSKREKTIAEWKSFSKGLDKKGVKATTTTTTPAATTTAPTTSTDTTTAGENKDKENSATQSKQDSTTMATTPLPSEFNTTNKDKDSSTSTTTTSSTTATKDSTTAKSKLNPNAKVFKPGSSSSTTSSGTYQPQPVVASGTYMYGGYPSSGENGGEEYINVPMYGGYPAYGPRGAIYPPYVPTQPLMPNQPIYPNGAPVRVAMAQPGYYPYPVYNQPGSPQMFPGARVMVPGNPAFYPQQQPPFNKANENQEATNNDNK